MNRKEFEALLALEGMEFRLRKFKGLWSKKRAGRPYSYKLQKTTKWFAEIGTRGNLDMFGDAYQWRTGVTRRVALRRIIRSFIKNRGNS